MLRWAQANGWSGGGTPELVEHAAAGSPIAVAALQRGMAFLAAGIITAAILLDLDRVVIGGGVAAAGEILLRPLREAIAAERDPAAGRVRIVQGSLGRQSGLVGAARYAQSRPAD
jgi:glucokinase